LTVKLVNKNNMMTIFC